jgi:hypothetical protein
MRNKKLNKQIGSDFDDFLAEQGLAKEVSATALQRVISWQVAEAMKLNPCRADVYKPHRSSSGTRSK